MLRAMPAMKIYLTPVDSHFLAVDHKYVQELPVSEAKWSNSRNFRA